MEILCLPIMNVGMSGVGPGRGPVVLDIAYTATQFVFKFKLPSTKSVTLNWGDGTTEVVVGTDAALITKTSAYSGAGTYTFYLTGDVTELTYIDIHDQAFVTGNISGWSALINLTNIFCRSQAVSGDISGWSALTNLTSLLVGDTSVSGDISSFATLTSLTSLWLNQTSVTGDISGLSTLTSATQLYFNSTSVTFGSAPAWTNASATIWLHDIAATTAMVNNMIESLSTCTDCTINVAGTNAHRTAASNDDLNTLLANGNTITLNDVLGDHLHTSLNAANDQATQAVTAFSDYAATIDGATKVDSAIDFLSMVPQGSEIIIGGTFVNFDNWSPQSGEWTNVAGKAAYDATATRFLANDAATYTAGKYYLVTYEISGLSAGTADINFANQDGTLLLFGATRNETNGSVSFVARAINSATALRIYGYFSSGSGWSIDNFSIKELQVLGSDLVTDGAFANTSLAAAKGVDGITKANPGVVTFDPGHGYVDGDVIYFSGLTEMTELNTEYWILRSNAGDTFELQTTVGNSLDTSGYGAAETTGGNVAQFTDFTSWIEGIGWRPGVDGAGALNGLCHCDGSQGANSLLRQVTVWSGSATGLDKITVSNYSAGNLKVFIGGSSASADISANGTYEFIGIGDADTSLYIRADVDFIGDIDNVSGHELTFTKEIAASTNYTGTHYVLPVDENDFAIPVTYAAEAIVAQKFGGETNAVAGFTSVGLDGTGANKFESQVATVDVGEFAIEADANDTPTADARFHEDLESAPYSISNGDVVRLSFKTRHIGVGGDTGRFTAALGVADSATTNIVLDISKGEIAFVEKVYYWTHDANHRYFNFRERNPENDGGVFFDDFKVQKVTLS